VKNTVKSLESQLLWCLALVTTVITPFISYDPFNIPKFALIVAFASIGSLLMIFNRKILFSNLHIPILTFTSFFIIWALISSILSTTNKTETFYGVTGRQTGFITYASFIVMFLIAIIISSDLIVERVLKILLICGMLSTVYGVAQFYNLDFFDWINPYSPVIGFFGNPNFQSSFLGICAVGAFSLIKFKDKLFAILLTLLIFTLLYSIYLTQSRQGYLVVLSGIAISIIFKLQFLMKNRLWLVFYLSLISVTALSIVLDMLQKSPWKPFVYKESVTYRGDFWRSGWQMTVDNPIFGVGLDGFRDNYRTYKDMDAALRPIPDAVVDSAHNVFLDISSGGGFPLLFAYLGMIFYTLLSTVRISRRLKTQKLILIGIFSCWVAFTSQSLISMNNIGIAIWGWVFSGLLIGYEINTRKDEVKVNDIKSSNSTFAKSLGVLIGILIVLPQVLVDAQFKSSVESKDYSKIYQNSLQWPQSVKRITLIAEDLSVAGFPVQSRELIIQAIELNPRNFEAWLVFARLPNSTTEEVKFALEKLRELDPLNPGLK
jgi:O-antigen ligase